jgi:hypothetical protein
MNLTTPLVSISPYILVLGLDGEPSVPDIVKLPDNNVLPSNVLLPI